MIKVRSIKIIIPTITLIISILAILLFNGVIWFNNPSSKEYPVRGVDVSSYQGKIDWDILSNQNVEFAFIKATEGSSYQDQNFQNNWEQANKTELKVGAYHFFSYDSAGKTQAQNFISTVPVLESSLPPAVDIEFYGNNNKNPLSGENVLPILNELLDELENHYGKKPIIYATMKSYQLYIKDNYDEYPLWIRNVISKPVLQDSRDWTFWQYSHRQRLNGYSGKERYIDMNVFNGSKEDFYTFTK